VAERWVDEREQQAEHVLHAYRERRRRRRGDDTYFGSADCLLTSGHREPDEGDLPNRRQEILEEAAAEGVPEALAGELYDVAREEGLDPALAFELVRSGIGVVPPPGGVSNAPEQPSTDRYVPEWLGDALPPDELLRERTLRLSFRRLRSMLVEHEEVREAFRAFVREPDVGPVGY
jgi:hypothetical protein